MFECIIIIPVRAQYILMNPSSKTSSAPSEDENEGPLTFEKVWRMFQETDKKFQEAAKETDKKIKETWDQIKETSRGITRLERQFTSMWGKLVESLVEGDLIRLLNERGIAVERTQQRVSGKRKGQNFEFDIIAVNGDEIVVVEVKTTLKSDHIIHFVSKLGHVREWLPEFHDKKVYGAVAFIHTEENVITHGQKCGLLVIRATGNSASIINDNGFLPKTY
jgi:Holliday junction resolvase